jgi:lipopolysaccharide transport system ATP-binding protein
MSDIVIAVDKLSKRYLVGHQSASNEPYTALRDVLAREARNFVRKAGDFLAGRQIVQGDEVEEFWALKDVSFEVKRGEILGIIGRNGAGKSTLLKILSRITEPSAGRVVIKGRIASLLEVGTGFHPELTGRENIYLNGAILGMARAEVRRKFDEIVAFAEIEQFLDTPVKRYSSGMYVRLAFAVAAHLEPEILLVDEVLAVGDADFQRKCLGKMESIAAGAGRTILFISHNMTAIANLCQRAAILDQGKLVGLGDAGPAITQYLSSSGDSENRALVWPDRDSAPGNDRARVHRVEIVNGNDRNAPLTTECSLLVIIEHWNMVDGANTLVEIIVRAIDTSIVFHSYSRETSSVTYSVVGLYRTECIIPAGLLNEGVFYLEVYFLNGFTSDWFMVTPACTFSVADTRERSNLGHYGKFVGHVHPRLEWRAALVDEHHARGGAIATSI